MSVLTAKKKLADTRELQDQQLVQIVVRNTMVENSRRNTYLYKS